MRKVKTETTRVTRFAVLDRVTGSPRATFGDMEDARYWAENYARSAGLPGSVVECVGEHVRTYVNVSARVAARAFRAVMRSPVSKKKNGQWLVHAVPNVVVYIHRADGGEHQMLEVYAAGIEQMAGSVDDKREFRAYFVDPKDLRKVGIR